MKLFVSQWLVSNKSFRLSQRKATRIRSIKDLQDFWHAHDGQILVLCTIVAKTGSGYRGIGAKKLIASDGTDCGILSGGCLEAEIAQTAFKNWDHLPHRQVFSTLNEDERLMGTQTGCAGVIDILFEQVQVTPENLPLYLPFGSPPQVAAVAVSLAETALGQRMLLDEIDASSTERLIDPWVEPQRLFILGSGPECTALCAFALALGWDVTVFEHRRDRPLPSQPGIFAETLPLSDMAMRVAEGPRTALVLTSHNYETDLQLLWGLVGRSFGYVGCVGPRKRFEQLCEDLRALHGITMTEEWAGCVHAPAGLRSRGREPETIALSIIAEIQFGRSANV